MTRTELSFAQMMARKAPKPGHAGGTCTSNIDLNGSEGFSGLPFHQKTEILCMASLDSFLPYTINTYVRRYSSTFNVQ